MDTTTAYSWVPYYEKLANALLPYADKRQELIQKLWASFREHGCHLPKWNETHTQPADIDPFTVFSVFCIFGMKPENRKKYLQSVAEVLEVDAALPTDFNGISCMHPQRANFYSWDAPTGECDNLWTIFKTALQYADGKQTADEFIRAYDVVHEQKGIQWNITIGLFWIRPNFYINLDSTSRDFIANDAFYKEIKPQIWKRSKRGVEQAIPLTGKEYATFCNDCRELFEHAQSQYHSFPELSSAAWKYSQENKPPKPRKDTDTPPSKPDVIASVPSPKEENVQYYTKDDFLHDVFMTEEKYAETKAALEYKYNIILQGPPGVGKSYAAKRLAYSLMGEWDDERICMIQFHHSYSYEDFMQGYRPDKDGKFTLRNGIFYDFCKKAESSDKEYYLIIDEINRGDLNKIFGETFLLMEKDKRGTNTNVKLAYSQKPFSIPDNIRIIGMMNTADRSIAFIDHALRRRFAFIDLEPAFGMAAFQDFVQNAPSSKLQNLLKAVISLNDEITGDSSLGKGYRIGHSYFCPPNAAELTDERLKTIVEFELIPLLEEYWFDEPDKVKEWSGKLEAALQ